MAAQFRYSEDSYRSTVFAAAGLTAIVTFLVWLFARLSGSTHVVLITTIAAICFFTFCSAAMLWRYWRGQVVLAVRPDGLFDARHGTQALAWNDIRHMELGRAENEFHLIVHAWRRDGGTRQVEYDLAPLDADVATILNAISAYRPVALESV